MVSTLLLTILLMIGLFFFIRGSIKDRTEIVTRQNPMEDIWLERKKLTREFYHLCKSFKIVKYLFEFVTHKQIFNFPKLFMYGKFSQII